MIFRFKKLVSSFRNGLRGVRVGFIENNFRLMFALAVLALGGIIFFPLERWEAVVVVFLIGAVLSVELINSQFERVLDIIKPTYDKRIKNIKDISAGAVLVISITSLVIGLIIFIPYLVKLINNF